MNSEDGMSERNDCGHEAAAYVLGALEAPEAAAFRRHMTGCSVCRNEVLALEQAADALPMAAPQVDPPADLKRRVMTEVRADAKRRRAESEGWLARMRLSVSALARRPALATGALVATVALAFGVAELSSGGSSQSRTIRASVIGVSGTAALRVSRGHAELTVAHIPPPPEGRIYEVWLRRDGQRPAPTSALFSVTSAGTASVDVPGDLHGVRTVMVTAEPLGGSTAPTRSPVIVAQLS